MSRIREVLERRPRRFRPRQRADESPRRRRRTRWWLIPLGLILVAIGFAPQIASLPPVRDWLVRAAAGQLDGVVSIDSLSLGWFSGVRVTGLKLAEPTGEPIVQVDEVRVDRGLWSLVWARDLGIITLTKPRLNWIAESGGSNLETALAAWLKPQNSKTPTRVPVVQLQIVDGAVQLSVRGETEPYHLDGIQGRLVVDPPRETLEFDLQATSSTGSGDPGELKVKGNAKLTADATLGPGNLDILARDVPVAGLRPLLLRIGEDVECGGTLATETHVAWTDSPIHIGQGEFEIQVNRLTAEQLTLRAARWLKNDRLTVERFQGSGRVLQRGATTIAHQVRGESEFARIEANGQFDWAALAGALAGRQLPEDDFSLSGPIDLAHLLRMLPESVPMHRDVELRRADLAFTSFNRMEGATRRWLLDAEAKNLEARQAGRPLQWDRPARVSAAWVQDGGQPRLESLKCETSSLEITGGSDLQTGKLQATGDLGALLADIRQIFPLEGYELAGKFQGEFGWSARAIDQIGTDSWPLEIAGALRVQDLVVRLPGYERFVEPQAEITVRGSGVASRQRIDQLQQASLQFAAGADRLSAQLTSPIQRPDASAQWPLQVELSGGATTWLGRLRPLLPAGELQTSGQVWLQTPAVVSTSSLQCAPFKLELKDWTLDGWGLHLQEPQVSGTGDLTWEVAQGRVASRELTVTSSSLAARAVDSSLSAPSTGWQVASSVSYRADLNRVHRWFFTQFDETGPQWFGEAEGTVRLVPDAAAIRGELDLQLKNLTAAKYAAVQPGRTGNAANPWTILWQEPLARMQGSLALDPSFNSVQIERVVVQSQLVGLEARGTVSDLSQRPLADITGVCLPNWNAAVGLLQAYAGKQIELAGSPQPQAFAVRGPLLADGTAWVSPELTAEASLAWEGGRLYGLPLGRGQLVSKLEQSVLQVEPVQIPLSQGTVNLSPRIELRGEPTLVIVNGTILESIALTPEVCRDWMKYIAPVLAEATQAQGTFSLATEGVQLPLLSPERGTARGKLVIDSASVLPGPLGQQLVGLANSVKQMTEGQPLTALFQPPTAAATSSSNALLNVPRQEIGWELRDGQVFHEGLTINVRGIPIKTSGGVGLDSKLNLLAEVPIQEDWIKKHPFLASLRGSSLRLPIVGTRSQPRIDPQAWGQFLRQWAGGAASAELNNQLNDFFNQQLGGKIPGLNTSANAAPTNPNPNASPPLGDSLQKAAETQLQDTLNKLLGPKKK